MTFVQELPPSHPPQPPATPTGGVHNTGILAATVDHRNLHGQLDHTSGGVQVVPGWEACSVAEGRECRWGGASQKQPCCVEEQAGGPGLASSRVVRVRQQEQAWRQHLAA